MKPMVGMPNEPPDWWKRWRPLRWLAGLVVVLLIAKWLPPFWPSSSAPKKSAAAPAETTVAVATTPAPPPVSPPPSPSKAEPAADPVVAAPAPAADTKPAKAQPLEIIEEDPITPEHVMEAYTARPPEAQRLTFFAPFRSYASIDDTRKALEKAHYEPQLTSRHARVADGVPPSDLDIMTVDDYRHLDQGGTLELQFFNDRLYQVEFEPHDAAAYRARFRREWPQVGHEKSGRSEVTSGSLRIASSLDLAVSEVGRALHSRPYVLWQDLRLVNQRNDWDYQFAKLATQ